jgi:hypothetical protein
MAINKQILDELLMDRDPRAIFSSDGPHAVADSNY